MRHEPGSDRRLILFLARNCAVGILVGWALLSGLILSDVGGLGGLIWGSDVPLTALALAGGGFAVTFGSLAMGTAIFLLPKA